MQSEIQKQLRQELKLNQTIKNIRQEKPINTDDMVDLNQSQLMSNKMIEHGQQGRWTKSEHLRFVEALSLYGKNWKKVEDHVGTRSGAQIRSHAQKFFNRLEREFNQQFNGLKSSEIKLLFENTALHNLSFGDKDQSIIPRKRSDSINTNDIISEEELIEPEKQGQNPDTLISLLDNHQQQQNLSQLDHLSESAGFDCKLTYYNNLHLDMNQFLLQNIKQLEENIKLLQSDTIYQDEFRTVQYQFLTDSLLINNVCKMMQAFKNIKENDQENQQLIQKDSDVQEPPHIQEENQEQVPIIYLIYCKENDLIEEPCLKKKNSVTNIGQDESFFHFIIAKYRKFFKKNIPTLNELVDRSERKIVNDKSSSSDYEHKSRRGSFVFYNDQEEENETKYKQLKKIKENNSDMKSKILSG